MAKKIYYTMGEVSEMFGIPPATLRFWEAQFPQLRPKRSEKKGNRLYSDDDIAIVRKIYYLVKERGLKIKAAVKQMRGRDEQTSRDAEIVERLQNIRALLLEIKNDARYEGDEVETTSVAVKHVEPEPAKVAQEIVIPVITEAVEATYEPPFYEELSVDEGDRSETDEKFQEQSGKLFAVEQTLF